MIGIEEVEFISATLNGSTRSKVIKLILDKKVSTKSMNEEYKLFSNGWGKNW